MPAQEHISRALTVKGRQLGAFKRAAKLAGIPFEEYLSRIQSGQKRCIECRSWKSSDAFGEDSTRWDGRDAKCLECRQRIYTRTYEPIPLSEWKPMGPPRREPRGGDKLQARYLINLDVKHGKRPNPNALHCAHCGHFGSDRRHEYHHHMGYESRHHYDVIPLCSTCHHEEH